MIDYFLCNILIGYDSKMSQFIYFLRTRTGLISLQLFYTYHVHIHCIILINE